MPKITEKLSIKPFWSTSDGKTVKLYQGDVLDVLKKLPSKSVQCCVTSPPYWGLRDYETGEWEGGKEDCDHIERTTADAYKSSMLGPKRHLGVSLPPNNAAFKATVRQFAALCGKCGAKRIDRQIGSERIPDCQSWARGENCAERDWSSACHVCRMVLVFRELRRVLRDDGMLWVNYGDSYSSGNSTRKAGLPAGNLVGVPWRVALAMQADGWILRQDIIWRKESPMPESVKNRCTKAHEYVFLLTKRREYYCDMEAIRDPLKTDPEALKKRVEDSQKAKLHEKLTDAGVARIDRYGATTEAYAPTSANRRSVWSVDDHTSLMLWLRENNPEALAEYLKQSTNKKSLWSLSARGYEGAHFATFSEKLITPMIKAGTSERGCCAVCKAPWRRVVEEKQLTRERPNDYVKYAEERGVKSGQNMDRGDRGRSNGVNSCANSVAGVETKTIGWQPSCECHGKFVKKKKMVLHYGAWSDRDGLPDQVAWKDGNLEGKEIEKLVDTYVPDIPLKDHPVVPCVCLDIFMGSGTMAVVALGLGRHAVGIDLSETYLLNNAIPRVEGALSSRPSLNHLIVRKDRKAVDLGDDVEMD